MTPETTTPKTTEPDVGRSTPAGEPLLRLRQVRKRYGQTQALAGADLDVMAAEVLGLVGHNGAGKSTLMRVIAGITRPDQGDIEFGGRVIADHSQGRARSNGVRIVFQELSLCPDLRVFENVMVSHGGLAGWRWRARARRLIADHLDEVFPGHGISPWARVETLSLGQRQMVEIAQATLRVGDPRLVILDEPTSALDGDAAASLFRFMDSERKRGVSFILISHRISEILRHTNRVAVMRDGAVVAVHPSSDVTEEDLVTVMGGTAGPAGRNERTHPEEGEVVLDVRGLSGKGLHNVTLRVGRGEVVGLAGLEGQGQKELLLELWRRRSQRGRGGLRSAGRMAFVTGDRQEAGVFPLWSLAHNISIGALHRVLRHGGVSPKAERELTSHWLKRLAIRGDADSGILDLSGGNQQKVLIARALAAGADTILLDDPFRGVDISTRQDTYRLIREEAAQHGRCFVWFSTENAELQQCDRVYVLSEGAIAAELAGDQISEEQIIASSFASRTQSLLDPVNQESEGE